MYVHEWFLEECSAARAAVFTCSFDDITEKIVIQCYYMTSCYYVKQWKLVSQFYKKNLPKMHPDDYVFDIFPSFVI